MSNFYTSVLPYGSTVLYIGYENGSKVIRKADFEPTLYVPGDGEYRTLWDEPLQEVKFNNIRAFKDYLSKYEDISNMTIYGQRQIQYQYIHQHYPGEIQTDQSLIDVAFIDIECAAEGGFPNIETANEEILLISIVSKDGRITTFSSRPIKNCEARVMYHTHDNEIDMLKDFVHWWEENTPDIISGWNIDRFDIPYIIHRLVNVLGEQWAKRLSPWNQLRSKEMEDFGKKITMWEIVGVNNLDYMDLYKKYTYSQQESWALDHIASIELGESKKKNEWGSFRDWYKNDFDSFAAYNIHDADLVNRLEQKRKFIELVVSVAHMAKCNIRDVFSPVRTWDVFIYNFLADDNIVIPNSSRHSKQDYAGAYVKEPVSGLYGWVMSFDFASLYPSIIRQWNISPETWTGEELPIRPTNLLTATEPFSSEYSVAANGTTYRVDKKGFSPKLMKHVMDGRKIVKKEMLELKKQRENASPTERLSLDRRISSLDGKQQAYKILANSYYGAVGNVGFRYYNLKLAEAITLTGQAAIQHVEKTINEYLNKVFKTDKDYVITMDTDSCYLNVQPIVDELLPGKDIDRTMAFLYKFEESLQKVIDKSITEVQRICNCFDHSLSMKREVIASRGLFTTKKRYALKIHDSEGVVYKPYKLKIMGLDIIKTSTPQAMRDKLREALVVIFEKDEEDLQKFVEGVKAKFFTMPADQIAFPRSLTDMNKWVDKKTVYRSGCPIHVRAALLHNTLLNRIDRDIQPITTGDKVKFLYLKMPNPIHEDVIGFVAHSELPPEFGLDQYIDYEKQWEKVFVNPLKAITDKIGWHIEKVASLEDFFA